MGVVWKMSGIFKADAEKVSAEIESIGSEATPAEIVTIINYAGFGLGIGSGRSSGYGRYHVVDVK